MWSLQDAKNKFSSVVDAALAGEPQAVTRRGKPAVVVIAAAQYDALEKAAQAGRGSFRDHLLKLTEFEEIEPAPRSTFRSRQVDL